MRTLKIRGKIWEGGGGGSISLDFVYRSHSQEGAPASANLGQGFFFLIN